MGNSLHNKIYLGRRMPAFGPKGMAALLLLALVATGGVAWLAYELAK
ncbi:MAG: hypothetical protein V4754_05395 [Pseudomonadota bacterium]